MSGIKFSDEPVPLGRHAERALALGPVFPLLARQKEPATAHGFHDASANPDTIRAWWVEMREANVGIATGAGLVVLDFDGPEGDESKRELEKELGQLPATYAVTTGAGRHEYYRIPVEAIVRSSVGKVAPGVDVRAHGAYVVAAGSVHPDGPRYQANGAEIVQLPEAWLKRLTVKPAPPRPLTPPPIEGGSPYGTKALEEECRILASTPRGGRNDQANRSAFSIGTLIPHLLDEELAFDRLMAAARASGLTEDDGEPATFKTLRSGIEAGKQKPRRPEDRAEQRPLRVNQPSRDDLKEQASTATSLPERVEGQAPNLPAARLWLERGSDLLAEPDPGPTPWLVESLLVDRAIAALMGPPKTGKTWALLELALSIMVGFPAFGRFTVPEPGSVILVLEESGRDALYRRLDALRRGYNLDLDAFQGLHFAANRRVRLDDPVWQQELVAAGKEIRPRAMLFDPLARLKSASRDENVQKEMAPILDFLRELRDEAGSAIAFVHHTGHAGTHLRGTSDLESYWESKLSFKRDKAILTVEGEHREASDTVSHRYRLAWDNASRSIRLAALDGDKPLEQVVAEYLQAHPDQTTDDVAKGIKRRREEAAKALERLAAGTAYGTAYRTPSLRPDAAGRRRSYLGWNLAQTHDPYAVPEMRTARDGVPLADPRKPYTVPTPLGDGVRRDGVPTDHGSGTTAPLAPSQTHANTPADEPQEQAEPTSEAGRDG